MATIGEQTANVKALTINRRSFRVLDFRIPLQGFQTHEDVVNAFKNSVLLLLCNPREQERGLIGVVP